MNLQTIVLVKVSTCLSIFKHQLLSVTWVRTFLQLSWITQSGLAPFPECHGFCGIVPNGLAGLVISLQYTLGLEVLACTLKTDLNYVTTMLKLCLF